MSDSSVSTGPEVALSTNSPPTPVAETREDAPEPSTPSEISFEVKKIEEDQDMPQRPLDPRACPFRPVSPFSALSILGAYAAGQTQEQVQEITEQIAATLQWRELEFRAREQRLQEGNERARSDIARLRAEAHQRANRTPPCPQGFIPNGPSFVHFWVPFGGQSTQARYVRRSPRDSTVVEGTMGGPGDDIYYHELYARPYPSTRHERFAPEGLLPGWIQTVLDAVDPQF